MKKKTLADWVRVLLPHRWIAGLLLIVAVDACTILSLSRSSGQTLSFAHQDKVFHTLGFFILTLLGHLVVFYDLFPRAKRSRPLLFLMNLITWVGYGLTIEFLQGLSTYREASLGDFVADCFGITLAALCAIIFKLYPRRSNDS